MKDEEHIRLVLPTHVGVILKRRPIYYRKHCTTHTRGGDPGKVPRKYFEERYYPHTWG